MNPSNDGRGRGLGGGKNGMTGTALLEKSTKSQIIHKLQIHTGSKTFVFPEISYTCVVFF